MSPLQLNEQFEAVNLGQRPRWIACYMETSFAQTAGCGGHEFVATRPMPWPLLAKSAPTQEEEPQHSCSLQLGPLARRGHRWQRRNGHSWGFPPSVVFGISLQPLAARVPCDGQVWGTALCHHQLAGTRAACVCAHWRDLCVRAGAQGAQGDSWPPLG